MEIEVEIVKVLEEQKFNTRNGEMTRHSFVGRTFGDYPKEMCFEVVGDERWGKMSNNITPNRRVSVRFDASSREWQGRWFTSLTAFSVFAKESEIGQSGTQSVQQSAAPQPQSQPAPQPQQEEDPLPF
jgi:hypothetical protein